MNICIRILQQLAIVTLLPAALLPGVLVAAADAPGETPLKLTLTPQIYAVPGVEMSVYFDNVVLTEEPHSYHFAVECAIGRTEDRRWTVIPQTSDVGRIPFA
ncbi:MAG TPA: hypothetical protein EYG03_05645, partial [Planctomycetes bacterium]|nr:hypothetical protein [Planctomycetota bacterium]